jgi:hypothetical protein
VDFNVVQLKQALLRKATTCRHLSGIDRFHRPVELEEERASAYNGNGREHPGFGRAETPQGLDGGPLLVWGDKDRVFPPGKF